MQKEERLETTGIESEWSTDKGIKRDNGRHSIYQGGDGKEPQNQGWRVGTQGIMSQMVREQWNHREEG